MLNALKGIFAKQPKTPEGGIKVTASPELVKKPPQLGNWREDRERLRTEAKKKLSGLQGTVVYILISHMHGRIHMKSYKLKAGGWRTFDAPHLDPMPPEMLKRYAKLYGEHAQRYYEGSAVSSLQDQATWISKHLLDINSNEGPDIYNIGQRILSNSYAPRARVDLKQ